MANANPYAHSRTEDFNDPQEYPEQENARYAAPDLGEGAPYIREFGWSPSLRLSAEGIPDDARLGIRPLHDFYPDGGRSPEQFYGSRDATKKQQESVTNQDSNGWTETKGIGSERRFAPNPREIPPPESRVTQQMAPRSYSFWRPFGHGLPKAGTPRYFDGEHFSMADHRRNYEIGGMAPATSRRNTFRISPTPWDTDIVDIPPNVDPVLAQARVQGVDVAYSSRNWRLQ
jgi:hypothetical protein